MLVVVLDNIRSGENTGSIIRTAEALGFEKVYLCGITPPPTHPKVAKASLGAEKNISVEKYKNTSRLIESLKRERFYVVAMETKPAGKITIYKLQNTKKKDIAIIVGNEVKGIGKTALKRANKVAYIPMTGKKESLNVAVAFGIGAYQLALSK